MTFRIRNLSRTRGRIKRPVALKGLVFQKRQPGIPMFGIRRTVFSKWLKPLAIRNLKHPPFQEPVLSCKREPGIFSPTVLNSGHKRFLRCHQFQKLRLVVQSQLAKPFFRYGTSQIPDGNNVGLTAHVRNEKPAYTVSWRFYWQSAPGWTPMCVPA